VRIITGLKNDDKKAIIDYYDHLTPLYRIFWYKNQYSFAMHYGFWDRDTKDFNDALLNENKFLAEKAKIKSNDVVLDAGCGVGGSTIWLAKELQAKVTGISINKRNIREAGELARKSGVSKNTKFYVMDYLKTEFDDNSFDVVWAIESVCYSRDKRKFLKEAYRLLRTGGRLVVADGFLGRTQNKQDGKVVREINDGFGITNLVSVKKFGRDMEDVGFKKIVLWNKKKEIMPTSKSMYYLGLWGYPLSKVLEKLRLISPIVTRNSLTCLLQYNAFKRGLIEYVVFCGEK